MAAPKFPAALLTAADVGGDVVDFQELALSGDHTSAVTTITCTAAIPASWPTVGYVSIDSEIIKYTGKSGSTLTGCTRGAGSAAPGNTPAAHSSLATVGMCWNAEQFNQLLAEIIALETQALGGIHNPNLVPNSDFGRRTVFGLAMPEVFADTSGMNAVDGSLGAVAGNVLTAGTNGTWSVKWCGTNSTFYRDARFSFLVKQNGTGTTNVGRIGGGKGDGTAWTGGNGVYATYYRTALNTVTLELIKVVAGVTTVVASQTGVTWADGRVGWAELEAQGTTYIARFYDQGSGNPGVKSSATRLDNGTLTGTIADAGVVSGQPMAVNGSGVGVATVWGGVSTGNGGVYVETWLPESWTVTFSGTLGGQAVGYDESADSGPVGKQWALRGYIPAASRGVIIQSDTPDGSVAPSVAYAGSGYMKTSGKGGTGDLITCTISGRDSALGSASTIASLSDAGETAWTRKTGTASTASTSRRARLDLRFNTASTATGTAFFMLPQLEQGSAATAWRNAPADDAPIVWNLLRTSGNITVTADQEYDSRDLAGNLFFPWDATVRFDKVGAYQQTDTGYHFESVYVDGAANHANTFIQTVQVASVWTSLNWSDRTSVSAGKHRVALHGAANSGTDTILSGSTQPTMLIITATRGR